MAKIFAAYSGAVHIDFYGNLDVIPFDKIRKFFEENEGS